MSRKNSRVKDSKRPPNSLTIGEATRELEFSYTQYTRRLYLEGKLEGIRVKYKGYTKIYITRSSIEKYRSSKRRTTLGRRYLLYAPIEREEDIRKALDTLGIEYKLELAYKGEEEED